MIVDSHCHAWRHWPYDTGVPDPKTRGSIGALLYEMDTHGVDHATVVCARIGAGSGGTGFGNHDNNDYVSSFARAHPDRITAWVDVDCAWRDEYHVPGAPARLVQELERTGSRGFTHYLRTANDGWLRSREGREFFRAATQHQAIASLAVGAPWFEDLQVIAQENPTLPILIHHMSSPRPAHFEADLDALVSVARQPNIGVKISGFNYNSARTWDFPYQEARALFHRIYDAFGPRRLYWGSDFPASRDMLTYTQAIEVVRTQCDFVPASELSLILGTNLDRLLKNPVVPG